MVASPVCFTDSLSLQPTSHITNPQPHQDSQPPISTPPLPQSRSQTIKKKNHNHGEGQERWGVRERRDFLEGEDRRKKREKRKERGERERTMTFERCERIEKRE